LSTVRSATPCRLVDLAAVAVVLSDHGRKGRSGVGALRAAFDDWAIDGKPADSILEAAFARLIERFALPGYEFHPVIEGWEVDFRLVGTSVLIECDGWTTHGLGHRQFERDRRRDDDLAAAGWIVRRFTYRAITATAADTVRRIRRLVERSNCSRPS
jgi:very-short-patch-repair endonuclease